MGVSKLKLPSYLWLVLAPVGLSLGSAFCLAFLLDFDRDLSPAWHLALYGLMSFSLLAAVSALGFHPSFAWTGWLRYLLPVFPLLVLAGMFRIHTVPGRERSRRSPGCSPPRGRCDLGGFRPVAVRGLRDSPGHRHAGGDRGGAAEHGVGLQRAAGIPHVSGVLAG